MTITISNKKISKRAPIFIIAEAGVNHNGSLQHALKMIDAAAQAGADAVKFQTFKAEEVVSRVVSTKSGYRKAGQFKMLKKLELKQEFYQPIIKHCKKKNIIFLSTPHGGFSSVDFLESLHIPAFKFGSGDLTNLPLLLYTAKFKKPIILGTGISTAAEVEEAIECIQSVGNKKIIILHCTTHYPCPVNEVNLRAMQIMMRNRDVLVGYSDHTLGDQVSTMAATLGACVIEKHFTLDKNMSGPDQKASMSPVELKNIIDKIRKVEIILGSDIKQPSRYEIIMKKIVRKSLVALQNIKAGDIFVQENLGMKRPGTGLAPKMYFKILGKKAKRNISLDSLIKKSDYV